MAKPEHRDYPWRRNRRRLLFGIVVFFGGAVLALAVVNGRGDRALQREIASIRAKGEPVTPQELRARYPEPPKEQNAAEVYTKSFSAAKRPNAGQEPGDAARNLPTKAFRKWVDERLAENAEALALLHEAAHKPAAQFSVTLDKGWWSDGLPDREKIRGAAILLQLEALAAAQDGDTGRALEAVLAGLAVGNALYDSPLVTLLSTRMECYRTTCEGIRQILSLANFSEDQLAQMQRALDAADDGDALTRALMGERVATLFHFDHPEYRFSDIHGFNEWMPGAGAMAAALMRVAGNHGRYLSVMGQAIDASRMAPWEALPQLRMMAASENGSHSRDLGFPVNTMLGYACYGETCLVKGMGQARSAQIALAVERYRLANGVTPENAGLLVPAFLPAVPADPCDGQPLRYKPYGDGYVVYSGGGGPNDVGGTAASGSNGEFVFRVAHTQ